MKLIELPKEIEKARFEEFLEQVERDFPAREYPELLVQYQELGDGKILILGLGEERECAKQTVKALEENPKLRENEFGLKVLRVPETKFLLRRGSWL